MTIEQIKIIDKLENWEKQGYIVDVRWAFSGYKCIIWEIHNDHDIDIEIKSANPFGFKTRWEAYDCVLEYLDRIASKKI